jgi:hypothetical protein
MKITTRFRVFELRRITLVVISAVALLLGRPAFAGEVNLPLHTLDITENSSTSLTVIFDSNNVTASVVALNSPDHWTLTFDPSIQFGGFFNFWIEPDDPTAVNSVGTNGGGNVLGVVSDLQSLNGLEKPDGTPQNQAITVNGQDGRVDINFHDLGDAPVNGVPESASTLALLFVSLTTLLGASRLRSGRFA